MKTRTGYLGALACAATLLSACASDTATPLAPSFDITAAACDFTVTDATMRLNGDCETSSSIVIPDGFTLDGAGYTITAVDPAGSTFVGAVVRNGGTWASVQNLTIATRDLANACKGGADRLRGIMFDGANGSILYNTIVSLNKGASGCQEGNAIEVRNLDGAVPVAAVEISRNVVNGWQKTGIVANGAVDATITQNTVGASATQAHLAANGVQVGFGATGYVAHNRIAGNSWHTTSAVGTAILVYDATAFIEKNDVDGNADVGIYLFADNSEVSQNKVLESGADGAYDIGIGDYGTGNVVSKNFVGGYDTPYEGVTGDKNRMANPARQ